MKLRKYAAYLALILVAVPAAPCFADHFALATSQNSIYMLREGGTWSGGQTTVSIYSSGSGFSEIKVQKDAYGRDWVFAANKNTGSLMIGRVENVLTSPSLSHVQTINLGIVKPKSIAIDSATGGVYVMGNDSSAPKYAYVAPATTAGGWTSTINTSVVNMDSLLYDIASRETGGGIIVSGKTADTYARQTHLTSVDDSGPDPTYRVGASKLSCYPSAVAVQDGRAYVTSSLSEAGFCGTLDVVDIATEGSVASVQLPQNFDPQDVTTFTLGTNKYLGIIGVPRDQENNSAQAWMIPLDASGIPNMAGLTSYQFIDEMLGGQQCAVSEDGTVFWSTHPGMSTLGATVSAMSTDEWDTQLVDFSLTQNYGIANITAYEYVPEPSAFASLMALSGMLVTRLRRRKRG